MPKQFFTDHDIEDLVKKGVMTLEVSDDVVLTDLAYEKARKLGMRLLKNSPENPPAAPVRPYISQKTAGSGSQNPAPIHGPSETDLHQRIKNAVIAKMGNSVDPSLLDAIISRVLKSTGVK